MPGDLRAFFVQARANFGMFPAAWFYYHYLLYYTIYAISQCVKHASYGLCTQTSHLRSNSLGRALFCTFQRKSRIFAPARSIDISSALCMLRWMNSCVCCNICWKPNWKILNWDEHVFVGLVSIRGFSLHEFVINLRLLNGLFRLVNGLV